MSQVAVLLRAVNGDQQAQAWTDFFGASRLPISSPTDSILFAARYTAMPSLMRLHECGS